MNRTNKMRVVLVGFGGLGMEIFDYIRSESSTCNSSVSPQRKNFPPDTTFVYADDQDRQSVGEEMGIEGVGTVEEFAAVIGDRVLIAVGFPNIRFKLWQQLRRKSLEFTTFIHSSALVSPTAKIGSGTIIGPMVTVNANAVVGDNVLLNCYASIGHGAHVGSHTVLSPYASVLGEASVDEECWLGTRASVFPQVTVGRNCTIDSHSFAKMDVPDDHIVRCRTDYQVLRNRLADSERKM